MSINLNRRQFMGAAAAGMAVSLAAGASDHPSASEKVIIGVMGLSRGRAVAETFANQPNVEVRYMCDVDSERAEAGAASIAKIEGQKPKAIGDFRTILDDKEVDALICAAPNHWHGPATILACSAGKHVYVEKPCCHNPREAELMVEAARKHNRAVQIGTQRRSDETVREGIQKVHDGVIGRVYSARAMYSSGRGSIGHGKAAEVPERLNYELWQGPAPRMDYLDNRVHYNWHWFWHWGNGELGNNGVHALDVCRWGLDVGYPTFVSSSGGRYVFDDDQETPDTHTVSYEFPGEKMATWQGQSCNKRGPINFVEFYGETGTLCITSGGDYIVYDQDNKELERKGGSRGDAAHAANFLSAIREDDPSKLTCGVEDGHKGTMLSLLGNIAQRTRRNLRCDPDTGHILDDAEAMKYWAREYEPGWEPKV